jgi:uncharacterized protein YgbK (DUF1537 family)
MKKTIIIADDLTGANDAAIQFVKLGKRALVLNNPEDSALDNNEAFDVFALNTNSRELSAEDAYSKVLTLVSRLGKEANSSFFYKKIDSVLRGNPGSELSALLEALNAPLAIAAPSFPANHTVVRDGIIESGRTDGTRINAVEALSQGTNKPFHPIPLEIVRKGTAAFCDFVRALHNNGGDLFIADAVEQNDLFLIYAASLCFGVPVILGGSAALASEIARTDKSLAYDRGLALSGRSGGNPVLIMAGTRQGETAAQVTTLSRIMSTPVILFKVDDAAAGNPEKAVNDTMEAASSWMKNDPDLCIIAVDSMFKARIAAGHVDMDSNGPLGETIAMSLGSLAEKLLKRFNFNALICTGGDTSLAVCERLGIDGIEPIDEICPGIPLGRFLGGRHDGLLVVTKSGRFGDRRAMLEIIKYLGAGEYKIRRKV